MTLSVGVQPGDLSPGAAVALEYELEGELDGRYSAIRTGLTCEAHYIVGERGRDANGHPITRDVMHVTSVYEDTHELPVAVGPGRVQFQLPADARPASDDVLEWTAWASLTAGDGGEGPSESAPVAVRAEFAAAGTPPDATANGLTLRGLPGAARTGETVSGTLVVDLPEHVKVRSVAVRLIRRRTYVAQPVDGFDGTGLLIDEATQAGVPYSAIQAYTAETEAFGKRDFDPGSPAEAAFELQIPPDAGPDTFHANGQVDWRVEATLHRLMHDDVGVATVVRVY